MKTAIEDYIDGIAELLNEYKDNPAVSGVLTAVILQGRRHIPQGRQQIEDAYNKGVSSVCVDNDTAADFYSKTYNNDEK